MAQSILMRPARASDIPMITHSWLTSFRGEESKGKGRKFHRGGLGSEGIPNRFFYYYHHKVLESLIPNSIVMVACLENSPDTILGWVCAQVVDTALVVHYAYTKYAFRKYGIARRLLKEIIDTEKPPAVFCTHLMPHLKRKVREMGWLYNPYLLYMALPLGWQADVGRAESAPSPSRSS